MAQAPTYLSLPHQFELLSQMVEDISGELALEPLLQRIVERACKLIGADDGLIGLYVPETDLIRIAASHNIPPQELRAEVPRGHGLTGAVLERDAPVRGYYHELPNAAPQAPTGLHVIGMPIRARGRFIGAFGIGAHAPRVFGPNAQELLDLFTRHAAIAIDNAQRYSSEQRRAARFALIARVAGIIASAPGLESLLQRAADAIHELLEYQNVDIPLVDPDDPDTLVVSVRGGDYKRRIRHVDRLPVSRGIMGAAVRERRTQLVNDVRSDPRYVVPPGVTPPRAEMAVPILHAGVPLGVLNVEGDHAFDMLDRTSLEIIAEHLGTAIVNARLFESDRQVAVLEERQRLARDLHDNVTQIVSSMSLITQSLEGAWQRDPAEASRRSARLGELAQLAFAELREMLHELAPSAASSARRPGPPPTPPPLPERLRPLLQAMVPPQVRLEIDMPPLPPQSPACEDTIVRICQEAVSNALRHASPSCIRVSLALDPLCLRLAVSDDGRGIATRAPRGMGLDNMRQRLHALGGSLQIRRRRPRGTSIVAQLPRQDLEPER